MNAILFDRFGGTEVLHEATSRSRSPAPARSESASRRPE
jgi:hypothetical protein